MKSPLLYISMISWCILSTAVARGDVTITVGKGASFSGTYGVPIEVTLENLSEQVQAIQMELCDVNDYLTAVGCENTERTQDFTCAFFEEKNGCVGVVLYSLTCETIIEGDGSIFKIIYDVSQGAPAVECRDINPQNMQVKDHLGQEIPVSGIPGEYCFLLCGDVYPRECLPPACIPQECSPPDCPPPSMFCGDAIVNIFDMLEAIDFVLGASTPSECQLARTDVPTGTPPYCEPPDGELNLLDILVIKDKSLGSMNCCDYYTSGKTY